MNIPENDQQLADDGPANKSAHIERESAVEVARAVQLLSPNAPPVPQNNIETLQHMPVEITVQLGSTILKVRDVSTLTSGAVIELKGLADKPMDILINGHMIAQGGVVVVNDKLGVRLTDILSPLERLEKARWS